ncbi:MAG: hypothetical protein WCV90_01370 [Candidatus Woesearchaeota archaeon]|jgi:hypothetical protein
MKGSTKLGFAVGLTCLGLSLPHAIGYVSVINNRPIVDTTPAFMRRPENPYVKPRDESMRKCTQGVYDRHLNCVGNGINDSRDLSDLLDSALQSSIEHTCARIHNREMFGCLSSDEARYWDNRVRDFENDLERYER